MRISQKDAERLGLVNRTFHKYKTAPADSRRVDGILFDSKKEMDYYLNLKLRVRAGEVRYFLRQVPFHLPGEVYRVDFLEVWSDGSLHWVDVKGMETASFRRKKKLVESLYPVEIELA